ncbi:hypothetical protein [Salinimicrobium sp. WS361]|uniref:hypothetical protein n=1 Tax=Salinimicrobium sp. WS361 TaxID=3425123 RepID=UPI003D6F95B1
MKNDTDKELLSAPYSEEPEELFHQIGKVLARLDSLKHGKTKYFHGFKHTEEDVSVYEEFELKIIEGLSELYLLSLENDFFWIDCSLQVYKNTFKARFQELLIHDPELTENELLKKDYRDLDNLPFFQQRFLRTDKNYIGIDYGQILDKRKETSKDRSNPNLQPNPNLLQKAEKLRYKLERARTEKQEYIRQQFQAQGKMIIKSGNEFILIDIPTVEKRIEIAPPHSHIFAHNGFKLFQYLLKNSTFKNSRQSDIAYFYWRMYNEEEKYIHVRPERFKDWFFKEYQEILGKLKTLDLVESTDRNNAYLDAIEWLKAQ